MDRRGFLKFMGVSAAATSASAVLAGIPEVAPKIELLEPKKIVTSVSDDVMLFDKVKSIRMCKDENMSFRDSFGVGVHPQLGRFELSGRVTVYPDGDQTYLLMGHNERVRRVAFTVPELRGKLFVMSACTLTSSVGEHTLIEIDITEIRNDGSVEVA